MASSLYVRYDASRTCYACDHAQHTEAHLCQEVRCESRTRRLGHIISQLFGSRYVLVLSNVLRTGSAYREVAEESEVSSKLLSVAKLS